MNIFHTLQNKPERIRKRIFWVIIVIFSLILFIFWASDSIKRIDSFNIKEIKEKIDLSEVKENLNQISGNDTKKSIEGLKDKIKETENMADKANKYRQATSSQEQATSSRNVIPIVK